MAREVDASCADVIHQAHERSPIPETVADCVGGETQLRGLLECSIHRLWRWVWPLSCDVLIGERLPDPGLLWPYQRGPLQPCKHTTTHQSMRELFKNRNGAVRPVDEAASSEGHSKDPNFTEPPHLLFHVLGHCTSTAHSGKRVHL